MKLTIKFSPVFNRACAEWLLRCGASFKAVNYAEYYRPGDYNVLPPLNKRIKIEVVDATDAEISSAGFDHFRGCEDFRKIILKNCR